MELEEERALQAQTRDTGVSALISRVVSLVSAILSRKLSVLFRGPAGGFGNGFFRSAVRFVAQIADRLFDRETHVRGQETQARFVDIARIFFQHVIHGHEIQVRFLTQSGGIDLVVTDQGDGMAEADIVDLADAAVRVQAADFARQRDAMPLNDPRLPALLDRQMAEALPANRPEILRTRVQYGMATAESVEELEVVRRQIKELIPQLPPEEAQVEQNLLDKFFHDLPALLETLRRNR